MPRTLTKSRFRLARECPTKLFYTGKPDLYPNNKLEDSFLEALAEGGFQVGELAKLYHPGGIEIEGLGVEQALAQTAALMERDEVLLFEPAFLFEGLFVRVDVLVKKGDTIDLVEVKAKSCEGSGAGQFLKRDGFPTSDWKTYFEDIAFQKYVVQKALPAAEVQGFLMLADKTAACPEDGLHQKFLLKRDEQGRARVEVTAPLSQAEIEHPVLARIDVDAVLERMLSSSTWGVTGDASFEAWVNYAAREYAADRPIQTGLGPKCKSCEFRATAEQKAEGLRSGFEECWLRHSGLSAEELSRPTILEIWDNRRAQRMIDAGRVGIDQVEKADLGYGGEQNETISRTERQWLQVDRVQRDSLDLELRRDALKQEMDSWTFPLHFIDFETAMPAIPMHRGSSPYTQLAFQFSHHLILEDGSVEHRGQFLDERCGEFPNFAFLRALRSELGGDEGTIFRYAPHENTILVTIRDQLMASEEDDRNELIAFIESIAQPRGEKKESHPWPTPARNMVDLCALVKSYIYDPRTNGSNSIKKVLPATLERSEFLQRKYSKPIYGAPGGICSLNFESMTWVQKGEDGTILDPYKLLPALFTEAKDEELDALISSTNSVNEGGAAMTAWARMQFTEMSEFERRELSVSLLKYCELDTLAMVMLYEAWREWC